jgi:phospholipase/carboxylesterase
MNITPQSSDNGLEVACVTEMAERERGGTAVVLLHGWRAAGDDLVGLAKALLRPGSRLFVPAAPLTEPDGRRAWWHLEPDDRPAWAWDDRPPAGYQPHPSVTAARLAVQRLLTGLDRRYGPDTVAVVGFSQGAMLALDLGVRVESGVDRVAAMSGVMLADSLPALAAPGTTDDRHVRFLLTHGLDDEELPFQAAETARDLLDSHGRDVTWRPFPGGHEIPPQIAAELGGFLFDNR